MNVITIQFFLKWWWLPLLTCLGGDHHHNPIFGGWWWLPLSIFPLVVAPLTMHHHTPLATSPRTMRGEYPPYSSFCGIQHRGGAMGLTNFHDIVCFLEHHPPPHADKGSVPAQVAMGLELYECPDASRGTVKMQVSQVPTLHGLSTRNSHVSVRVPTSCGLGGGQLSRCESSIPMRVPSSISA